jgi:purine-binding chemotaxis protein CheW
MPLMLLFRIGTLAYGLEIESIQEVADDPPRYPVPASRGPLLGAINLHGRVLPVIDLPAALGIAAATLDQRLIVLNADLHALAMAVSAVGRIVPFETGDLAPPADDATGRAVAGIVEIDAQQVNLLDVDAVIERLESIYGA